MYKNHDIFYTSEEREEKNKEYRKIRYKNHHFYTIRMTEKDDLLVEYYDENVLNPASVIHNYCYGEMDSTGFKNYKILYCKECNLRIEIPLYIMTFKDLKEYFEERNKEEMISREELLDLEE